jgi:hypothetical protein
MHAKHTLSRRAFLQALALLTAGGSAAAIGGCKAIPKSTPQSYYRDHRDEFIAENRKLYRTIRPQLAEKYGESEADAILEATTRRFDKLLPDLPYIGGSANELTTNLVSAALALGFYRELKDRGATVEETGQILFQAVTALYASGPMNGVMGRMANSELAQKKARKEAEISQQHQYPEDWVFEFVPGNQDFDFGIDYTECGICKYYQAQGAEELTPFMCLLDAPISRAMNTGLVRTKTLAQGDDRCDFRYKTGRDVQLEWDPGDTGGGN